jgi:alkanesulfonate monooxygenase SsuD/methylene tetrahydromethanopterin reductase-like flavin-dependent oxidoreductase (luciferase family)
MKEKIEVFWFSEQPYGYVTDEDLAKYPSGRLDFPNTYFDPHKAHILYNQYHDQYALADEVGFDGIMTNKHHASYWCMKPAVNLDAAVICKVTKKAKIAILGNVIAINDPIRMAEEIAMLDCYSGGRIISGFVRGTAVESLHGGIDPTENFERFQEAHDLIIKCWTTPGPFRYEGKYYHSLSGRQSLGRADPEAPSGHLVPGDRQPRERGVGCHPPAPLYEPGGARRCHGALKRRLY